MFERLRAKQRLYKEIEKEIQIREEKQRQYDLLVKSPLEYGILRDLVNSATPGKVIDVKLADNTTITIRQEDPYSRAKTNYGGDF